DHGKTALVKALSGIDCDTLAEEKLRGITINLGFAHLKLPDGTTLGIVDVPGHQRFVRNMVAGAAGIDMVLLVVAADDGVMPQTAEHLHIARLLGVAAGLTALTKIDLVDDELRELALEDIKALSQGTFLEGSPVVPVSATTGEGIEELKATLAEAAALVKGRPHGDLFRMPVDRSFTIKGAGTVVTGTTHSGVVKVDDEVQVMPGGKRARVRSLQAHGQQVESAGPGRRTAINLAGLERDEVQRGDVLTAPGSLLATAILDARVEMLPARSAERAAGTLLRPLRRGSWLALHIGTAEVGAKLVPLEADVVSAGQQAVVQLRLSREVAIAPGDRFILRSPSADATIGGGVVLDAHPTVHRRRRAEAAKQLGRLLDASSAAALSHEITKSPYGLDRSEATKLLSLSANALDEAFAELRESGADIREHRDGRQVFLTLPANRERIISAAFSALAAYHDEHPLQRKGMSLKELSQAIGVGKHVSGEVLKATLEEAVADGPLAKVADTYALPAHSPKLGEKDKKAIEVITRRLEASITADQPDEFMAEVPLAKARARQVLDHLVEEGAVVVAPGGLCFGTGQVEKARQAVLEYLGSGEDGITVGQFSKLIGSTRKYSIPLLQLFEQDGMLVRKGDIRVLKKG
ncbi:selenocysteine-specific translation elongation factor, partial [bacterium]|nr:selenocysteine-specific translation elongation factor [bacterium]